jgi:hypothetical protein
VVVSGLKMMARAAAAGGFGVAGGLVATAATDGQKVREQFSGLTVEHILKLNEKSFYVSYAEVDKVTFKKGLTGIGKLKFFMADKKFQAEIPKSQFEAARLALNDKLAMKISD